MDRMERMGKHSTPGDYEDMPRSVVLPSSDDDADSSNDATLLSEPALAVDWNRPEEDEAWSYLERRRLSD